MADAIRLYQAGHGVVSIERLTGIPHTTFLDRARKAGIVIRPNPTASHVELRAVSMRRGADEMTRCIEGLGSPSLDDALDAHTAVLRNYERECGAPAAVLP